MAFVALETGSKIDEFSCDFGADCVSFLGTVNSPT